MKKPCRVSVFFRDGMFHVLVDKKTVLTTSSQKQAVDRADLERRLNDNDKTSNSDT